MYRMRYSVQYMRGVGGWPRHGRDGAVLELEALRAVSHRGELALECGQLHWRGPSYEDKGLGCVREQSAGAGGLQRSHTREMQRCEVQDDVCGRMGGLN